MASSPAGHPADPRLESRPINTLSHLSVMTRGFGHFGPPGNGLGLPESGVSYTYELQGLTELTMSIADERFHERDHLQVIGLRFNIFEPNAADGTYDQILEEVRLKFPFLNNSGIHN